MFWIAHGYTSVALSERSVVDEPGSRCTCFSRDFPFFSPRLSPTGTGDGLEKCDYFSKGRRRPWLFWPLEEMAPSHPILNRFPRSTHKHPPNQSVLTIHLLRHFDFNVLIIIELDEKMALDFVPLHSMAFPS